MCLKVLSYIILIQVSVVRIFLADLYGNPNKQNAKNETALHLACKLPLNTPPSSQDRRLACVQLILQWKGVFDASIGNTEIANLQAQDAVGYNKLDLCTYNMAL